MIKSIVLCIALLGVSGALAGGYIATITGLGSGGGITPKVTISVGRDERKLLHVNEASGLPDSNLANYIRENKIVLLLCGVYPSRIFSVKNAEVTIDFTQLHQKDSPMQETWLFFPAGVEYTIIEK